MTIVNDISRIFPGGSNSLRDERLAETRDTNTVWTLRKYTTLEEWEARADHIRQHILTCLGLWPLPEKMSLKTRVFDRIECDGYSVEKVFFESLPGYFVCGNLYRPAGKGPFPGIACPHGHWSTGRLEDTELGSIAGRCINLARQGHVAFSYDMVGYVDSSQIDHRGFGGRREDLWGIGAMGLQLWNSIRVIDFLESLADIDNKRIGCTGASGGGTQTFMLTAVDERVKAAAPVNMISAHMQGGCNCENQGHLRLGINNIEIGACTAPRPLFLVAATGDWTVNVPELEFPAIREIYRLYGAEDRVGCIQVDAPHNYNRESRESVYAFFGRVFLGEKNGRKFQEKPFQVETDADLKVFARREMPKEALDQDGVVQALIGRSEKNLESLRPKDAKGLRRFRKEMGPGLRHALGVEEVEPGELYVRRMGREKSDTSIAERLILGRKEQQERIPAALFLPQGKRGKMPAVLAVHPEGKRGLIDLKRGKPGSLVAGFLKSGCAVLAIDPFLVGESGPCFEMGRQNEDSGHFHTYNQATAACRVQDVLTGIAYLNSLDEVRSCHLLGLEEAGIYCLFARVMSSAVGRTAIDCGRLPLGDDETWMEEDLFIPAIRSSGDVRVAMALCAPGELLVHNTERNFPENWVRSAYRAAGKSEKLRVASKRWKKTEVVDWIVGGKKG
jgi:dienelactone hydrolase